MGFRFPGPAHSRPQQLSLPAPSPLNYLHLRTHQIRFILFYLQDLCGILSSNICGGGGGCFFPPTFFKFKFLLWKFSHAPKWYGSKMNSCMPQQLVTFSFHIIPTPILFARAPIIKSKPQNSKLSKKQQKIIFHRGRKICFMWKVPSKCWMERIQRPRYTALNSS